MLLLRLLVKIIYPFQASTVGGRGWGGGRGRGGWLAKSDAGATRLIRFTSTMIDPWRVGDESERERDLFIWKFEGEIFALSTGTQDIKDLFVKWAIPGIFFHYYLSSFQQLTVTKCYVLKLCWWLDLNHWPLVKEVPALPTEPQPLPWPLFVYFCLFSISIYRKIGDFSAIWTRIIRVEDKHFC